MKKEKISRAMQSVFMWYFYGYIFLKCWENRIVHTVFPSILMGVKTYE